MAAQDFPFSHSLIIGLPILACISWDAMPAPRTSPQTTYLCCCSIKDSCKSCIFIQRDGVEHGDDVRWSDASRGSSTLLY